MQFTGAYPCHYRTEQSDHSEAIQKNNSKTIYEFLRLEFVCVCGGVCVQGGGIQYLSKFMMKEIQNARSVNEMWTFEIAGTYSQT